VLAGCLRRSFVALLERHPRHLVDIMVTLTTSDNESFVVDKDVAERSVLIKNMLEGPWVFLTLEYRV
jgi:Skp1 family, tetramerisation domain